MKQKTFFLFSQVLSFRHKKQTCKNVADSTFNTYLKQKVVNSFFLNPVQENDIANNLILNKSTGPCCILTKIKKANMSTF